MAQAASTKAKTAQLVAEAEARGPEGDVPPMPRGGEAFGAWFDHKAADAACDFFPRYLRHTEAEWAGKPFVLQPWQRDIVRTVFGWKRADGTRLVRTVYIEIPRKNGKTEFAAGLALLMLIGDGEFGGQVYSMAANEGQAAIVFEKAGVMVAFSPALAQDIETFKTSLFCPQLHASFKPFSSKADTKHGFHPSAAVADELHAWKSGHAHDVIHKGTAGRRQPLEILITTAGEKGRGYGWEMHERAVAVLAGKRIDPSFYAVIFAAGPKDDWKSEDTVRKANPGIGISPKWDFIRTELANATASPRLENEFKRYHLNIWTGQSTVWLPMDKWDECTRDPTNPELWKKLEVELAGRRCWGGLDLGSVRDTTALCLAFPPLDPLADPRSPEGRWTFLWRFWLPEDDLTGRMKRDNVPYDEWHRSGALLLTPGNVTDYRAVKQEIFDLYERFDLREIGTDPHNATQTAVELIEEGIPLVQFRQGMLSMSPPSKSLERLVLARALEHGNHPVARDHAGNAAVATDPAGNIKPDKERATRRMDGIVAQVMSLARAEAGEDKPNPRQQIADGVAVG